MRKLNKLLLCLIFVCAIFSTQTSAVSNIEEPLLSKMSEEECISFIKNSGVVLPDLRGNESEWGSFVKQIITQVEANPYINFGISYTVAADLAEEIRSVVNTYYGIGDTAVCSADYSAALVDSTSSLQHSEQYGGWDPHYEEYNCYAYAIGIDDARLNPGMMAFLSSYISEYNFNLYDITLEQIADYVQADLESSGHERIRIEYSSMSTSNLCVNESIICFRLGDEDYHFMKYTSDGWLHKPATTQILRYLYTPTEEIIWTNERIYKGEFLPYTTTYTGPICFISYNGHDWTYTRNSGFTHTKSCSICGDSFQYTCQLSYEYIGDSMHNATCNLCHETVSGYYCSYIYSPNSGNTHTRTCALSNHESVIEACVYSYTPAAQDGKHIATCIFCDASMIRSCNMVSGYIGSGSHRSTCNLCGYSVVEPCNAEPIYCGNGVDMDVHSMTCWDCGNAMGSGTEPCSFEWVHTGMVDGHNVHSSVCSVCNYVKISNVQCFYKNGRTCISCGSLKDIGSSGEVLREEISEVE